MQTAILHVKIFLMLTINAAGYNSGIGTYLFVKQNQNGYCYLLGIAKIMTASCNIK